MIAERSDRAPKIRPFNVAICARRNILVFAVESQHHLGKSCRVRGEIFRANRHVENYTKTLAIASKAGRFSRRSSAASSPSGPLATTPRPSISIAN